MDIPSISSRINRIIGQLRGIERMAQANRDCGELIQQISAVKRAIDGISREIVIADVSRHLAAGERAKIEKTLAKVINI